MRDLAERLERQDSAEAKQVARTARAIEAELVSWDTVPPTTEQRHGAIERLLALQREALELLSSTGPSQRASPRGAEGGVPSRPDPPREATGTWHGEFATYAPREVEVIVDRPAVVRVMTAVDYHLCSTNQPFNFLGDDSEGRGSVRISVPYAGRWHLVVVAEGNPTVSWRVV